MADPNNPYRAPQSEVGQAMAPGPGSEVVRIARFWGLMFATPCFAVFFIGMATAGPAISPVYKLGLARWLVFAVGMLFAGWVFGRSPQGRFLPGIVGFSAGFSLGTLVASISIGVPLLISRLHSFSGVAFPWRRVALLLGFGFLLEGVVLMICFCALGSVIRWRIRRRVETLR